MSKEKDRQWDGRSRPSTDKYKKEFDRIFKKEKTLHEELMEGFEKEQNNEIHIDYDYLDSLKEKI